MLISLNILKCR